MRVGSSASFGYTSSSSDDSSSAAVLCARFLLLGCSIFLVWLSSHEPDLRSDYNDTNYTCPTPSLFRSSSDIAGSFATKRSYGSWEATVELGNRDADDDFESSGYKFVVPCSYRIDRLGHDYDLLDDDDEVVASVIVDVFTRGWSLEIYDCGANLLATVEQQSLTRMGLELNIKDSSGSLAATTDYELHPVSGDQMHVHGVGDLQDTVLSTVTHNTFKLGGQEWNVVMNDAGADDAGPGGDERVIAAIATYMTWKDLDNGKGSFAGVCTYIVVSLELAIVLGVFGLATVCAGRWKEWRAQPTPVVDRSAKQKKLTSDAGRTIARNPLRTSSTELQRQLSNELEQPDLIASSRTVDDVPV